MSAISPIVTVSTLYEYQTPDGRIVPLIYTRLATPEERQRIIDRERGDEWRAKYEREERV
jgi:hypothetical protein